jgi:hypothetical protein
MMPKLLANVCDVVSSLDSQSRIGVTEVMKPYAAHRRLFQNFVKDPAPEMVYIQQVASTVIEQPFRRFLPAFFKRLFFPFGQIGLANLSILSTE